MKIIEGNGDVNFNTPEQIPNKDLDAIECDNISTINLEEDIKLILIENGYTNINFDEYLYDLEEDEKIIAYNFNVNKDGNNILVSVEIPDNLYIIWEQLGEEQWYFIDELER